MIALLGTNDRNGCLLFRGTTLLSAVLYRGSRGCHGMIGCGAMVQ